MDESEKKDKVIKKSRGSYLFYLDNFDQFFLKKNNLGIQNVAVNKILSVNEGRTAASLVRDFLEKSNLDYTLSVFDPELNSVNKNNTSTDFFITVSILSKRSR